MTRIVLLLAMLLTIVASGCVSKTTAEARARAAFLAGQQHAQMLEARRINIRVIGNVRNSEIPWMDDLTLAEAIVAAGYLDQADPSEIVIIRQGARHAIDPELLLRGEDFPLMPGDTIEIRR